MSLFGSVATPRLRGGWRGPRPRAAAPQKQRARGRAANREWLASAQSATGVRRGPAPAPRYTTPIKLTTISDLRSSHLSQKIRPAGVGYFSYLPCTATLTHNGHGQCVNAEIGSLRTAPTRGAATRVAWRRAAYTRGDARDGDATAARDSRFYGVARRATPTPPARL